MSIFDYFRRSRDDSAAIAKERLQIIVAHERAKRREPDFLPSLQKELLEVIRRYVEVDQNDVEVQLDRNGNCSVLELNITLPELH